jgi:hypothetical protein
VGAAAGAVVALDRQGTSVEVLACGCYKAHLDRADSYKTYITRDGWQYRTLAVRTVRATRMGSKGLTWPLRAGYTPQEHNPQAHVQSCASLTLLKQTIDGVVGLLQLQAAAVAVTPAACLLLHGTAVVAPHNDVLGVRLQIWRCLQAPLLWLHLHGCLCTAHERAGSSDSTHWTDMARGQEPGTNKPPYRCSGTCRQAGAVASQQHCT